MAHGLGTSIYENDAQILVQCITEFQERDEVFEQCVNFAICNFAYHNYLDVNRHAVIRSMDGLCHKFLIHSQKDKADALEALCFQFIESQIFKEHLMGDINYSLLSLLIHLANKPTSVSYVELRTESVSGEGSVAMCEFDWGAFLMEWQDREHLSSSDDDLSQWSNCSDGGTHYVVGESAQESGDSHLSKVGGSIDAARPVLLQLAPSDRVGVDCEVSGRAWLCRNLQAPYWTGICLGPTILHASQFLAANLRSEWEAHVSMAGIIHGHHEIRELTERQILRETLWLLRGVKELFAFDYVDDAFVVRDEVAVSHLSQLSLHRLLSTFATCGSRLLKLRHFTEHISSEMARVPNEISKDSAEHSFCLTYQAYGSAVSDALCDFGRLLFSFEYMLMEEGHSFTLLQLLDDLAPWFEKLDVLHRIHHVGIELCPRSAALWQKAWRLHQVLYLSLLNAAREGLESETDVVHFLLDMFLKTVRPYIEIIDGWVRDGLYHNNQEFILTRNTKVLTSHDKFWDAAFVVRNVGPCYLTKICNSLLVTGKSMELLCSLGGKLVMWNKCPTEQHAPLYTVFVERLLRSMGYDVSRSECLTCAVGSNCADATDGPADLANNLSALWRTLIALDVPKLVGSPSHSAASYGSEDICATSHSWFSHSVGDVICSTLSYEVFLRCERTCDALLTILDKEFGLQEDLLSIRKFYLMAAGDVMFHFYSQIFDQISPDDIWHEELHLKMILEDVLTTCSPREASRLSVCVDESVRSACMRSIDAYKGIRLRYKISLPMNLVITPCMWQKYDAIFTFLMQVKRAKYSLDELRFIDLNWRPDLAGHLTEAQTMRMKLMHFVNGFHSFLMLRLLHDADVAFSKGMFSLQCIMDAHTCYLQLAEKCCLLRPKMAIVCDAVLKIMNVAIVFSNFWKGNDTGTSRSVCVLKDLERNLKDCQRLLVVVIGNEGSSVKFLPQLQSMNGRVARFSCVRKVNANPHVL